MRYISLAHHLAHHMTDLWMANLAIILADFVVMYPPQHEIQKMQGDISWLGCVNPTCGQRQLRDRFHASTAKTTSKALHSQFVLSQIPSAKALRRLCSCGREWSALESAWEVRYPG